MNGDWLIMVEITVYGSFLNDDSSNDICAFLSALFCVVHVISVTTNQNLKIYEMTTKLDIHRIGFNLKSNKNVSIRTL